MAKKTLRKEQRQEAAVKRRRGKVEIMNSQNYPKMFYKLMNNQRKTANKQLHTMIVEDVEIIELLCKEENSSMDTFTEAEIISTLKRLDNNKAVDIMGLTSEQFKLAGHELYINRT